MDAENRAVGFFDPSENHSESGEPERWNSAMDVPMAADERLSVLGTSGLFTSTLSVNEFALLSAMEPRPIAQVLGTSVYQVGWQYLPPEAQWLGSDLFCYLEVISQAWDKARRNAFDRLHQEALSVGADAVVGVRLRRGKHDWARRSVDFVVNGTAIRMPRDGITAQPMLSDLSVQDYWKLAHGGWQPAGLLAATAVFFVSQGVGTRWRRRLSVTRNQELHEFSDALSAARHTAVNELKRQARAVNADGIVGVSFDYETERGKFTTTSDVRSSGYALSPGTIAVGGDMPMGGATKRSGLVITAHAVGTAIKRDRAPTPWMPQTTLSIGEA